uniref:Protein kinase domain-containing protein n=1 Tax=Echinostoma caproni TaxID=27848 RepID=A0A183AD03_9TREM
LIREPITHPYQEEQLRHCTLVITDFGMACRSSELVPQQSKLGTVAYAAPEVCRQAGFSFKSDVWAYGVVLWELLTLELPFRTMEQPRLMYIIAMYNYTLHIPSDVPDMFSQLLRDCWSPNPDNRPSFEDIISRLQLTTYCSFLSMDADEMSQIQAGWRDSIQAHHQAEQESAAATLSSSMTRSQLAVMEEDLVVQMEQLRHEWESLDRERRQLAERAHQIDLMEESYNRMVGTMGQQFMLLAVLAANQLKEMPCQPYPRPPPPRRRPFVLGLFRRWGSTGEANTQKSNTIASTIPSVSGSPRVKDLCKLSVGSQRPPNATYTSSHSLALSSESLTPHSSGRQGCSRGGIPMISPPVNMKHVIHVDHDWLARSGGGLNDSSSVNMFPTLVDRLPDAQPDLLNVSFRSAHPTCYPILSPDCFQAHHANVSCACAPPAHVPCIAAGAEGQSPLDSRSILDRPGCLWDTSGSSSVGNKRDRSLTRMLRKAGPQTTGSIDSNDVLSTTSSVSVGSSNFFLGKQHSNWSPVSSVDTSGSRRIEQLNGQNNSFPCWNTSFGDGHPDRGQWCLHGKLGLEGSNSTDSSPSDGRRRFVSGPAISNLPFWSHSATTGSECSCAHCPHCTLFRSTVTGPCNPHVQSTHDVLRLLCSACPPGHLPRTSCTQSTLDTDKSQADMSSGEPCVEHALWSAFKLAASFSCLANTHPRFDDTVHQVNSHSSASMTGTSSAGHKRPRSNESGVSEPAAATSVSSDRGTNVSRSRLGRSKHFKRWKGRSKDSVDQSSAAVGTGCKTGIPLVDSRRRFQSADRWGSSQPGMPSVCCTCRGMTTLPELIGECIARQAELGDPHSPFLGMLAGSGRRPTASANHLGRCNVRNRVTSVFDKSPELEHDSQSRHIDHIKIPPHHSNVATDHGWGRASFDVLPRVFPSTTSTGPNKSLTNLPATRLDRSPTLHAVERLPVQHQESSVSLNRDTSGPDVAEQHNSVHVTSPGRPRLRSAEQVSSRNRPPDFSSHPSLALTSYNNPVAVSRDAYLKATKDGYLNRTAESVGSSDQVVHDYVPEPIRSYYNPIFYAHSGEANEMVKPSTASLNPVEVEEFLRHTARLVGTPVSDRPTDENDRQEDLDEGEEPENEISLRSPTSSIKNRSRPREVQEFTGANETLRRRVQRSPAMREIRRPEFTTQVRKNSEPLLRAPAAWSRSSSVCDSRQELQRQQWINDDRSNYVDIPQSNSSNSDKTRRTASPCGPFVALDSAFL